MDKNMINIDDLFRQRLGNGEEEDRAGAWLQMRELLDEKMPVGAVNWRRMLTYASGLLLLAAIGVGGYEISSSTRRIGNADLMVSASNSDKTSAITTNSNAVLSNPGNSNDQHNNSSSNSNNIVAATTVKQTVSDPATNNTANTKHNDNDKNEPNTIASNTPSKSNTTNNTGSTTNTAPVTKHKQASLKQEGTLATATKPTTMPVDEPKVGKSNSSSIGTEPVKNTSNDNSVVVKHEKTKKIPSTKNTDGSKLTPAASRSTKQTNNDKLATGAGTNQKNSKAQILKDSINKIVTRESIVFDQEKHQAYLRIDTIAVSKMPHFVDAPEVAMNDTKQNVNKLPYNSNVGLKNNTSTKDINPAAQYNLNSDKSDAKNILTTAKKRKTGWDWSAFSEKLRDFEYEIGKVKVYPGLIAGVNGTFGGNNNFGFQAGFTTEFVVNDQISVMGELKYLQHFNGGTIKDNYSANDQPTFNGFNWVVTTKSYTHSFSYSTLKSLELPISVRYSLGKFYVYAGGKLVYNMAIDVTEGLSQQYNTEVNYYPTTSNWKPTVDKLTVDDFGSRFGLGYLFGTSYEFTPSVMVDARITKTFWDNAATNGAKQISDLMLKGPSMQFSIIYRLNHQRPETVTPRY